MSRADCFHGYRLHQLKVFRNRLQILVGWGIAIIASTLDVAVLADAGERGTLSALCVLGVCVGVPIMRRRRSDLDRAFRAW